MYDIDFGGQNATGSNNHTSAINTNTEADTQMENPDDTSEVNTNRMSEDTNRLHFGRSPNEARMQTARYGLYNTSKGNKTRLKLLEIIVNISWTLTILSP